jgi:putative selenate reductase
VLDTEAYVERVLVDERYGAKRNSTPPRKVGSQLHLFDCLTCDKCIPVCPNDANFTLPVATGEIPIERIVPGPGGFTLERSGSVRIERSRQIANLADACNACGHCDVMCPEDGGPYVMKPRFFGTVEAWRAERGLEGLVLERSGDGVRVHARFDHQEFVVELSSGRARYRGQGFDLALDPADPLIGIEGSAEGPVDLTPLRLVARLVDAVLRAGPATWVGASLAAAQH